MEYEDILRVVPIRNPILGIDGITKVEYGKFVIGYRNIQKNQQWAEGHFPGEPIFPGTMIIETMAQICSFIVYKEGVTDSLKAYIVKVDGVKFIKSVLPDCRLHVHCECLQRVGHILVAFCKATVGDVLVASGKITLYFLDDLDE